MILQHRLLFIDIADIQVTLMMFSDINIYEITETFILYVDIISYVIIYLNVVLNGSQYSLP